MPNLLREETGATAIEYGLIAGLIAAVIITAVTFLGGDVQRLFEDIAATIGTAI